MNFSVANEDFARRRRVDACQNLDQGRLSRAVVADQADDLVAADGEVDVTQRMHGPEILLNALEADDRGKFSGRRRHCHPPARDRTTNSNFSYYMMLAQLRGVGNGRLAMRPARRRQCRRRSPDRSCKSHIETRRLTPTPASVHFRFDGD
jgi:hypothetical protein